MEYNCFYLPNVRFYLYENSRTVSATFLNLRFWALAIVYLVAGTLYNRYVMNLRGFDQIPRFSIESMKYHAAEALDWLQDMAVIIHANLSNGTRTRNNDALSSAGTPGINPVSHQSQVPSAASDNGGGFIRPQPVLKAGLSPGKRGEINPVSHQAQTSAHFMPSHPPPGAPSSPPPPLPAKKLKPKPAPIDLNSTVEEREFMLGSEEDDDDGDSVQQERTRNSVEADKESHIPPQGQGHRP